MIKQESIESLKSIIDITDIIGNYVQLKKQGSNYKGLCPFHGEKTPSFVVNPAKQFFHCFGCQASGDAIKFVMDIEKLSYPEAIEKIANRYNFALEYSNNKENFVNKNILEKLNGFYKQILYKNQEALNYLKSRGLFESTIEKFALGYAPSSQLQMKFLNDVNLPLKEATDLGVFAQGENGLYARLIERITFPIFGQNGKIIAYGGRTISNHPAKYINYANTKIFNKSKTFYGLNFARDKILKSKTAIIVEGYMDVIMLHQGGFDNSIATLGTALTESHLPILKKLDAKIIVSYDGDKAGIEAALKASKLLTQNNFDGGVIIFEEGKDPADMIKENQDVSEIFKKPISFVDFIFQRISNKYDIKNINDKPKIIQEIKEFIFSLPELIQEDIILKASQTFQIDKRYFFASSKQAPTPQLIQNIDIAEASLIKTAYENRNLLNYLAEHLSIDMFHRHQKELQFLYEEEFNEVELISLVMNDSIKILNEEELKGQIIKILVPFYIREKYKLNKSCSIEQKAHKLKMLNDKIIKLKKGIL